MAFVYVFLDAREGIAELVLMVGGDGLAYVALRLVCCKGVPRAQADVVVVIVDGQAAV